MRWQVSLQLAIGFGALFGLAYLSAEKFLGPPLESSAVDSAEAHAIVGASEVASAWVRARSGRRALVRALAGSPTFQESDRDLLGAALESATVQMGGGSAALVRAGGAIVAGFGPSSDVLAPLESVKDAEGGATIVRIERIGDELHLVAAAPVLGSDARAASTLVLASPVGENQLHIWTRGLPQDISVGLLEGDRMLASTVPQPYRKELPSLVAREVTVGDRRFRVAKNQIVDDVGTMLSVVGLASVQPVASSVVMERARLLITLLGGMALILALVLVLIAPSDSVRELIEDFNQSTRDLPRRDTQPLEPLEILGGPTPSARPSDRAPVEHYPSPFAGSDPRVRLPSADPAVGRPAADAARAVLLHALARERDTATAVEAHLERYAPGPRRREAHRAASPDARSAPGPGALAGVG